MAQQTRTAQRTPSILARIAQRLIAARTEMARRTIATHIYIH